ncbi:MAG TPA: type II toxin-antitoxin system HicA family toxin [Nitrospinota bacterium]|nr:type II toxin-antitoxin system HicA family toxin [Nitrospinota bacterium]|tara:strand:- start:391 stop:612 length:222 start_codon:yes stop_codon:yes gene_type:complete
MPALGPVKRKDLIFFMKKLDFHGPYSGGKHQFMVKENLRIRIPNPHKKEIGKNLLKQILREAGVDKTEWESLS